MSDSYNSIAKTNLVFGGVKVLQVIVNILKTKVVAILLGPNGVGIQTLLVSTITTLFQFSNCGIAQSGVREISINKDLNNRTGIINTLNHMGLFLGIVATFICYSFSVSISEIVFGDGEFAWMFKVVSVALLFESISSSQIAILQGIRAIKSLALSSLVGSILVVFVSIPVYYYFGEKAIPIVVAFGFGLPALAYIICRNKYYKTNINFSVFNKKHAKNILVLGITLMAGNGIMALFSLGLNTFINLRGSSADVGLFQAASTCTYSAINILVAILASDFFPRLSAQIMNESKAWEITNTQIDLFFLVLGPIISIMVLFPNFVIRLLYSSEFLAVSNAVQIMGISLLFRIPWHCFSYIILAKGDKNKYLFIDAILSNGLFFCSNVLGYYLYGITGIAISFLLSSLIVCVILYVTVNKFYGFEVGKYTVISGSSVLVLLLLLFVSNYYNDSIVLKILSFVIFGILITLSFIALEKKTHALSVLLCKLRRK